MADLHVLMVRLSELSYDAAAGKSNPQLARMLDPKGRGQYLRQQVSDVIHFIMENNVPRSPKESLKSWRSRALDYILRLQS
jgi:hypothetical protein